MNGPARYTPYHPRWHRSTVSTYWWLERWPYFVFILRELSSIFVAWFVVYLLLLVRAVGRGPGDYSEFLAWSATPFVLALNIVTLFFVFLHAITWFNLAPAAMVVHVGKQKVPGFFIAASNYAGWIAVSTVVVWLLLGG
jgi:fumarate reductase subunit C